MSTEIVRQFLSNVSSESALQVAQLSEDQLSEEELETVAGGVLDVLSGLPNPPTPAGGGNPPIPKPSPQPPGLLGNQSMPDRYDTFRS